MAVHNSSVVAHHDNHLVVDNILLAVVQSNIHLVDHNLAVARSLVVHKDLVMHIRKELANRRIYLHLLGLNVLVMVDLPERYC